MTKVLRTLLIFVMEFLFKFNSLSLSLCHTAGNCDGIKCKIGTSKSIRSLEYHRNYAKFHSYFSLETVGGRHLHQQMKSGFGKFFHFLSLAIGCYFSLDLFLYLIVSCSIHKYLQMCNKTWHCSLQSNLVALTRSESFPLNYLNFKDLQTTYDSINFSTIFIGLTGPFLSQMSRAIK